MLAPLPDRQTWYLATNLPAPGAAPDDATLPPADLTEVVRLYGLRMWVEQSYKQTKYALGWSQYQVRSDQAMRRHWQLVCCAFSFCWWHESQRQAAVEAPPDADHQAQPAADEAAGPGENTPAAPTGVLAGGAARRARLAGAVDHAPALLAQLVAAAPAAGAAGPP